ncbi:MAG: thiamine pyrophosphate-dependent enzyme, partial [Bryobacterales bacterium]|nr:thiamine pyrophosphate-dependent enzyme [Bryobacterales bacterium]
GTGSFETMYQLLPGLIQDIRDGKGPALIEFNVVRLDHHSSSDDHRKYRSAEELDEVAMRDPILRAEAQVLSSGLLTEPQIEDLRAKIKDEVDRAAEEADSHPYPQNYDVMQHVFSKDLPVEEESEPTFLNERVSMVQAINAGIREEMQRNPKIVMWGEDIQDPKGGVFGVTKGLTDEFGEARCVNSALAEASILGIAGGMGTAGYMPVIEIQFADYIWPAFMQMRDEIAPMRWRSAGVWGCPMVCRVACGGYIKGGPWHSANIEGFFANIPGWYVVYPSCAQDAKGLFKTAARMKDPVIFLEHKGLYRAMPARTPEPDENYLIPFGKAKTRRSGTDLTVVTWGYTVHQAEAVANALEAEGKGSVEVIDLRSIIPWDKQAVFESVRRTNRVVVAHEDSLTMGFGAEVAAEISQHCFDHLDAPVARVGAEDCFVPSAVNLERQVLPSEDSVRLAIERLLKY